MLTEDLQTSVQQSNNNYSNIRPAPDLVDDWNSIEDLASIGNADSNKPPR